VCYRVSANLDPERVGTCQLVDRLVTGEVDQCEVGAMTSQELDPERDADLRKKIKDRQTTKVKLRVSTMYKCHKCGKSEVISELKYVRALDEGAAQEITCTFCGAMRRV
jgi:DNA-directed RNA polymerase subunit M/transcription elongation factor TFIIS